MLKTEAQLNSGTKDVHNLPITRRKVSSVEKNMKFKKGISAIGPEHFIAIKNTVVVSFK